ncbi:MAG TPA: hypothetical protein VF747_02385 [Blastocatellia bacterium]
MEHLRRTFASLDAARSLPREIDRKFADHFTMWLEVINQPYFKPIITATHRLNKLINILLANPYVDVKAQGLTLVDLGTGQPPYTTVDLAERLPNASVHGFDLYVPAYMVLRQNGAYALFDLDENLVAAHAPELRLLNSMVVFWRETKDEFTEILRRSKPLIPPGKAYYTYRDGSEIIINPSRRLKEACSNPNLYFHTNEPGSFDLSLIEDGAVDVLWSFNCLLHYGADVRIEAVKTLAAKLRPGAIFMEGYTSPSGQNAVYNIWQRDGERLVMREFGFSVENLRYPLWPLHEDDPQVEMMNGFIGSIKSDVELRRAIECDLASTGSVAAETLSEILEHLSERGYSARIKNAGFVVIDCEAVTSDQRFPVLHLAQQSTQPGDCEKVLEPVAV